MWVSWDGSYRRYTRAWAVSGDAIQSRCVAVGKRHFLRLHLSTNHAPHLDVRLEDIHVQSSTKDCVFSLEQPRESDNRSFIIRFLISRVESFSLSVMVKGQHISGSPFQVSNYIGSIFQCKEMYHPLRV